MSRIVLIDAQKAHPLSLSEPLMEALGKLGWNVSLVRQESDLAVGDTLLVLGLANWAPISRPLLTRAGELGVRRILWNFEPLLPPDLPQSRLHGWFFRAKGAVDSGHPGRVQRLYDRIAYCGFTIQSWRLPWNRDRRFPVRQFSYAAKESRRLLRFWRDGLIDAVFVSLQPRQGFLSSHGVPSSFVPVGYHPIWGQLLAAQERDIDVLFLGNITRRRRPLLRELERVLATAGFAMKVVDKGCYGEERTRLLNRSKIVLNLVSHPWEFPGMRMLMAMSCKAMVISESAEDIAPYIHGEHLMTAARKDLADLVVSCLGDEAMRSKIAEQAYRFVTEEHTLAARLTSALEFQGMAT